MNRQHINAFVKKSSLGLVLLLSVWATDLLAQCKTFKLSDRGDTLNCVDMKGLKQGKWLVKVPELRGNPGYEEEGVFLNNKKDGLWRSYSEEGDLMSVENYKWGLKHGRCQYFSVLGLDHEEGWWAIDPGKMYDTIDVPDLYVDGKYSQVVIKNEGRSMKQGKWIWYDPATRKIMKEEEFIRDSAVNPLAVFGISKSNRNKMPADTGKPKSKAKPVIVEAWEKKNSGKKKVTVRDGAAGY